MPNTSYIVHQCNSDGMNQILDQSWAGVTSKILTWCQSQSWPSKLTNDKFNLGSFLFLLKSQAFEIIQILKGGIVATKSLSNRLMDRLPGFG